jgi:exodeoxyribonuclease VII large subunit
MNSITVLSDIFSKIDYYINSTKFFKEIVIDVEVTELKEYNSVVFLKICDDLKQTITKAIIFKSAYTIKISPGDKINITCSVRLYRTEIELIIKSYTIYGEGNNTIELAKLKSKLTKLGYFDNKKEIMLNYHIIGIISSLNAAGLKDFIHTINSRSSCKKIYIYPATMQGANCPTDIQKSIEIANKHNKVQILGIIRGGGSKDDLECFNDIQIAKAIFESDLPIVTGIGHQIDICIADLVADKNFITPTAVAQSITTENILTTDKINFTIRVIGQLLKNKFDLIHNYIILIESKLFKYESKYIMNFESIIEFHHNICNNTKRQIESTIEFQYKYLLNTENELKTIQKNTIAINSALIMSHENNLNIIDGYIKECIFKFDNKIKKLSKPRIICKETNEEIYTLTDFKKNQKYVIKFIDGSYNIKINKHNII